jgi:hypothetical protein
VINLLTSLLFFYGGQAHLTDRYTPDLARNVEYMSKGAAEAWWWFGLEADQVSLQSIPMRPGFSSRKEK